MTVRNRNPLAAAFAALAIAGAAACSRDSGAGETAGGEEPAGPAAGDQACDRACLVDLLDRHLAAVITHDPAKSPLAEDFRATQNAEPAAAGEGVWMTATALGALQRRYADPETGQAGYIGLLGEGDRTSIVSLRIRAENRRITEAEWIIAREDETAVNPAGFITNPPLETAVADSAPPSRSAAFAAVDSYFAGIEASDPAGVQAYPDCYRIENGFWMVGRIPEREAVDPAEAQPGFTSPLSSNPDSSCLNGFENLRNVTEAVLDMRYFFDAEANIVWATGIFDRADGAVDRRGEPLAWLYFSSIFRIEDGQIRGTHAAMHYLPPDVTSSGWAN